MASSGILSNTPKISAALSADATKVDISSGVRSWSFTLSRTARRRTTIGVGAVVRFLNHRNGLLRFTVDDISQDVFDLFWGRSGETIYIDYTETTDTVITKDNPAATGVTYSFSGPMQVSCGQTGAGLHQFTVTVAANRTVTP